MSRRDNEKRVGRGVAHRREPHVAAANEPQVADLVDDARIRDAVLAVAGDVDGGEVVAVDGNVTLGVALVVLPVAHELDALLFRLGTLLGASKFVHKHEFATLLDVPFVRIVGSDVGILKVAIGAKRVASVEEGATGGLEWDSLRLAGRDMGVPALAIEQTHLGDARRHGFLFFSWL
jgi:hypothetical protein